MVRPGTNRQVSFEVDAATDYVFETQVASDPRGSGGLIASGINSRRKRDASDNDPRLQEVLAFQSRDSGRTWSKVKMPIFPLVAAGGSAGNSLEGDPTVAYDDKGVGYYFTFASAGREQANYLNTSIDGGKTWSEPRRVLEDSLDHLMVASDSISGQFRGNLYAFGMDHYGIGPMTERRGDRDIRSYFLVFLRSSDGGRSWVRSVVADPRILGFAPKMTGSVSADDYSQIGLQTSNDLLVSKSGDVILTFQSWERGGSAGDIGGASHWIAISRDGGVTFERPQVLMRSANEPLMGRFGSFYPGFAIDNSDGPFANRIYSVWVDKQSQDKVANLSAAHSDDLGVTWSQPKTLMQMQLSSLPSGMASDVAYLDTLPAIEVNRRGILVVSWYGFTSDGVDNKGRDLFGYQRFVTASINGGETFLPSAPIADVKTLRRVQKRISRKQGKAVRHVSWDVPARLGDYLNIVSDVDGVFHHVWMDGRTGKQQMWYANVKVLCNGKPAVARSPAASTSVTAH